MDEGISSTEAGPDTYGNRVCDKTSITETATICKYRRIFLECWSEWRKPVRTRDITLKNIKERLTYLSTEGLYPCADKRRRALG